MNAGEKKYKLNKINKLMESLKTDLKKNPCKNKSTCLELKFPQSRKYLLNLVHPSWMFI